MREASSLFCFIIADFILNLIMLLLLDIDDKKAAGFMKLIKDQSYIKAKPISAPEAELLEEIAEIKKAFKNVEKIKSGKLKGRSAEELLDEL